MFCLQQSEGELANNKNIFTAQITAAICGCFHQYGPKKLTRTFSISSQCYGKCITRQSNI